jgi:hypothetical protein
MMNVSLPELPGRAQRGRCAVGSFKARDLYSLEAAPAAAVLLSSLQGRLRAVRS